jgi:hypothetical protein
MRRMLRKRIDKERQMQAEAVWVALSGARKCLSCEEFRVSGKIVNGTLFCDECDSIVHFVWPPEAIVWQAT